MKTNRVCQGCGGKSQKRQRINYSKLDKKYMHGSCRGAGKPYSHGKVQRQGRHTEPPRKVTVTDGVNQEETLEMVRAANKKAEQERAKGGRR